MPFEIERKFLVLGDSWRAACRKPGQRFRQGYLMAGDDRPEGATVRVRRVGPFGFLTVKGPGRLVRAEFEYEIPAEEADSMLALLCRRPLLEKVRHEVEHDGLLWHIDEFDGPLAGLVLAEVELAAPDQEVVLPSWAGREVTGDMRFRNSALAAEGMPQPTLR